MNKKFFRVEILGDAGWILARVYQTRAEALKWIEDNRGKGEFYRIIHNGKDVTRRHDQPRKEPFRFERHNGQDWAPIPSELVFRFLCRKFEYVIEIVSAMTLWGQTFRTESLAFRCSNPDIRSPRHASKAND